MAAIVLLVGNGLSIGVAPAFAVGSTTERLNEEIDAALRAALAELRIVATRTR